MVASANTTSPGIYLRPDSGQTWNTASSTYAPFSVASSADGTKLVGANYAGGIVYSINSGATWNPTSAQNPNNWTSIASSANGLKLAATVTGTGVYTNNGLVWALSGAQGAVAWEAVKRLPQTEPKLVAVVKGGRIYGLGSIPVPHGRHWEIRPPPIGSPWRHPRMAPNLAAVVNNGQIYTSGDSGATWTAVSGCA